MSFGDNLTEAEIQHLQQIRQIVESICFKGLFGPICVAGMVANMLNIVVLTRAWMSSSTNIYLTAVAVIDMLYLAMSFLFSLWYHPQMKTYESFARATVLIRPSANLCSNTTTWLTLCFTMERYVAVSYPILGRRICTQRRARCAVVCIVAFSALVTLPDFLTYNSIRPVGNETVRWDIVPGPFSEHLNRIGYSYINQAVFVFIPMIMLCVFNTLLIRSVLRASKGRKHLAHVPGATSSKGVSKSSGGPRDLTSPYTDMDMPMDDRPEPNPVLVKSALEASMKTTLELASGISQSFGQTAGTGVGGRAGLNTASRTRKSMLGEQHRITLMLITIVIAFILLQLPSTVPFIAESLIKAAARNRKWQLYMRIYTPISNLLLTLSGAMNFVFYSLFSAKFRRTCCMLLQRCNCVPERTRSLRTGAGLYSSAGVPGVGSSTNPTVRSTNESGKNSKFGGTACHAQKLESTNSTHLMPPSPVCYRGSAKIIEQSAA